MTNQTGPGRPRISSSEITKPYTVSLTPSEAETLRNLGNGNLTTGIRKAIETMTTNYVNQEIPRHSKPDYFSDPITRLAYDVYQEAYQPYGEANPGKVSDIEEWLRAGDLDDNPDIAQLAAEWLELESE